MTVTVASLFNRGSSCSPGGDVDVGAPPAMICWRRGSSDAAPARAGSLRHRSTTLRRRRRSRSAGSRRRASQPSRGTPRLRTAARRDALPRCRDRRGGGGVATATATFGVAGGAGPPRLGTRPGRWRGASSLAGPPKDPADRRRPRRRTSPRRSPRVPREARPPDTSIGSSSSSSGAACASGSSARSSSGAFTPSPSLSSPGPSHFGFCLRPRPFLPSHSRRAKTPGFHANDGILFVPFLEERRETCAHRDFGALPT